MCLDVRNGRAGTSFFQAGQRGTPVLDGDDDVAESRRQRGHTHHRRVAALLEQPQPPDFVGTQVAARDADGTEAHFREFGAGAGVGQCPEALERLNRFAGGHHGRRRRRAVAEVATGGLRRPRGGQISLTHLRRAVVVRPPGRRAGASAFVAFVAFVEVEVGRRQRVLRHREQRDEEVEDCFSRRPDGVHTSAQIDAHVVAHAAHAHPAARGRALEVVSPAASHGCILWYVAAHVGRYNTLMYIHETTRRTRRLPGGPTRTWSVAEGVGVPGC